MEEKTEQGAPGKRLEGDDSPERLFLLAQAAHREGKCARAVELFSQAILNKPNDPNFRWHRAASCFSLGQYEEAAQDYREASRLRPDFAPYHNDLGVVLARQGRYDEATACYRETIRLDPNFPDAYNNLGNALRIKGKVDEAIDSYREALRLRPAYPEAQNNLGIALRSKGKFDEACACYHEALRLRPSYPEAHHNLGIALGAQGRHDAAASCFRQATRLKPDYAEAFTSLGGALVDLGRHAEAALAYREAIRIRPNDARAHKCLGISLARQNKLDEAIESYRAAIHLRPDYADAHNDLGITLARQNRFEDAVASYRKALEFRPNYAEAHNNLGNALRNIGQFDEAIASYQQAIEIKPNYADAYNNQGIAYAEVVQFEKAVASYGQCIKLRPYHVDAHLNRALTWLRQGNFAQGWAEYEWRLKKRNMSSNPPAQPMWNGFPPAGLRILLIHEQGLGDSIHFIRYASLLKERGATVFFECPPRLAKLLERTPGIDQLIPIGQERPEHDVYVPLMTLPGLMGASLESLPTDIPYVTPAPELVAHWRSELESYPEFKVGINWQGNPGYAGDFHRSMSLRFFAPLAKIPGVRLFSLQKNDGHSQLEQLGDAFSVVDLGSRLDETNGPFMDTAAVMKNLDLFVTSDTAVAHLAGALGVPVWVALSKAPGWQWMSDRDDSPWYPTMRLFRQERLLDWQPVFDRIAQELTKLIPPTLRARSIGVRVSPGELFERIAKTEVDLEGSSDDMSRRACRTDLTALVETRNRLFPLTNELQAIASELREAVSAAQTAEEALRRCEKSADFGESFVGLARNLAHARGRWSELRTRIDRILLGPDTHY